jgi:hypothetical protein
VLKPLVRTPFGTEAKKILNKGERKYTEAEVKEILRTLSIVAELQIETEKYKAERAALIGKAEIAQ